MSTVFDPKQTLFEITEKFPESISLFVAEGFPQMADEAKRRNFGSRITLGHALKLKGLDFEAFCSSLGERIGGEAREAQAGEERIRIKGLLPCPVRIPLEEAFEEFSQGLQSEHQLTIETEFQAASVGAGWIAEHIESITDPGDFPEIYISAGFETFFDPNGIGKFREHFQDRSASREINQSFRGLGLEDPEGHYTMIAVVPAVFLVNTNELGDLPMPQSWEDILRPEYEKRVSLPVGDFDLFSGILLDIGKRYGDEGLRKLGRSLSESLHPAQMVTVGSRPKPPLVTIMPYFFTRMARPGSPMQAVWPSDGAIISPIFLLTKKNDDERLQRIIDYFTSRECGEILAIKGLFPSTHPEVDNGLQPDWKFSWLGWDWISEHNIAEEIRRCERLFEDGGTAS